MLRAVSRGLLCAFLVASHSYAQRSKRALVCTRPALAALKPMPKLSYPCDGEANEWDEKILRAPARVAAIKTLISDLSSFSDAAWWTTDTVDLNVCDFTHEPRPLTRDQRQSFVNGDYAFWLFGNDRVRLALIPDSCYQTEYGGSNGFLLYRNGGRVFVTQVLDGYFSRADNSVNLDFARLNGEEIIEISTGTGGLNPNLTNYYFAIDPRTNRAIPKNLFKNDHGFANAISSAMLFDATPASAPLNLMRNGTLAKTFIIYIDDSQGKIDDNGRTLSRKVLRWNGHGYR